MKGKINKISTLMKKITLSILIILIGVNNVFAATAPNTISITNHILENTPTSFPQDFHVKNTTEGKYVYCMEYAKAVPTSVSYTKSDEYTDAGINYILEEGSKVSNDNDYFIYQTALWIYMQDKGLMEYSYTINTFKENLESNQEVKDRIYNIVNTAKSKTENNTNNPTIKLEGELTFKEENNYYISNEIAINSTETNYNISIDNKTENTTYELNNNKIIVKIPTNEITKNLNIILNVSVSKDIYRSYKYVPSNSNYQIMAATYKETLTANDKLNGTIALNKVLISKQDIATKGELPGAKLVIKDENGNIIESFISTNKPHEIYLKDGNYTLTEIQAPYGYKLSEETIKFTVKNNKVETKVVMYNEKKKIPKEVIPVPPTGTHKTIASSLIGTLLLVVGTIFVAKNYKNEK